MDSIRIKNLRSIKDSGYLKINNINLLLGQNSSGKSSIVRLFPMIKESTSYTLRGPLLWSSTEDTYDYGSFADAVCRTSEDRSISFSFKWSMNADCKKEDCSDCFLYNQVKMGFLSNSKTYELNMTIKENPEDESVYVSQVVFITDKYTVRIESPNKSDFLKFFINDTLLETRKTQWDYDTKGLLPNFKISEGKNPISGISTIINNYIPDDYSEKLLNHDFYELLEVSSINKTEIFEKLTQKGKNPFKNLLAGSIHIDDKNFIELCNEILFVNIHQSLLYVDTFISASFSHTFYMMPMRYSFERNKRIKEYSVKYIDPSGKNVVEYLLSQKEEERTSMLNFFSISLGIKVSVEGDSPNYKSLYVTNQEGEKDNIVDIGYGYSQLLPIATMLWNCAYNSSDCAFPNIVVIEQPEVHLHPSLQAKMTNLFVEAINLSKSRGGDMRIILETHSSVLVNSLGRYIRNNKKPQEDVLPRISSEDVSVYLFEKKNGETSISQTNYDSNGRIQKWPIGFLD